MPYVKSEHITQTRNTIKGWFLLSDKSKTHFSIDRVNGWQQWGNSRENLGLTVDRIEKLQEQLNEYIGFEIV